MFKERKRIVALFAFLAVTLKGIFSFLSWVEKQEDPSESLWIDEEELEEV